ncbi:MAG: cytochrome c3 family protein [Gallionella sp.]
MFRINRLTPVVWVMAWCVILVSGGVLAAQGLAGDCLSCHVMGASIAAKDPNKIYSDKQVHHPIGINYPQDGVDFNPTNALNNELSFFDANNNAQADIDEIRLDEVAGVATVTCTSCHREHEQSLVEKLGNSYLRRSMEGSELCIICHRK